MVERLGFYSTLVYALFQFGNENRYGSPGPLANTSATAQPTCFSVLPPKAGRHFTNRLRIIARLSSPIRRIDLLQLLLDQNETIASIHVIESVAGSLANNAKTTALVTLEQVGPSIDNSSFN